MYTYVAASRRRCLFACGTAFPLLLLTLVFVSGCSDDSVSPGGTGPTTIEWTVENPSFFSYGLTAVWAASPDEVFAVGVGGEVLHFDGSAWKEMESGVKEYIYLKDVFGTTPQSVFAVGDEGTVLEYDGTEWRSIDFGQMVDLSAVWAASESDVFVTGYPNYQGLRIFHYDGSSWSAMECPTDEVLTDLWGTSHDNVYATGTNGTMIHFDGAVWNTVDLPAVATGKGLYSVCGSSSDDIYAVGDRVVLHFDGSAWQAVEDIPPPPDTGWNYAWNYFARVWTEKAGDAYVITRYGEVLHFGGSAWRWIRTVSAPCPWSWYVGIGGSGSDVYVVGTSDSYLGSVLHYDGGTWESITGPVESLYDVWGSSDRDVFAVGQRGTILHFDGTRWSAMNGGTCAGLRGVWGTSRHDVFAAGDGVVLHFDGAAWERIYTTSDRLSDVWGAFHNDVFCVGESGIHRFNGTAWDVQWTGISLESVWGRSSNNVYAAGYDTFLRFDGRDWIVGPTYRELSIEDLDGTSGAGSAVYAAGRAAGGGIVARFDGSEWTTVHELGAQARGVWVGGDIWNEALAAVGGRPAVVSFFDGGEWEDTNLGEALPRAGRELSLNAVWSPDGRSFFAVGDGGLIVRGKR